MGSEYSAALKGELVAPFDALVAGFEQQFGSAEERRLLAVVAPGRSEIAGNHTDHEGGCVIAAAVDCAVCGVFAPTKSMCMRVWSEGYGLCTVDVGASDALSPREEERNSTAALVRGMAALFAERGYSPCGFDAYVRSEVPAGSGLSSSAAFELELARAMDALWAENALGAAELAMMAQRCEREWFGKPCGLMDQAASSLGGIQFMDFAQPGTLEAASIDFDFAEAGYALCLVEVGADHAALTSEYAAVPAEMQAVARELGHERLGELEEGDVLAAITELRSRLGDRPVLRALHYYREDRLVRQRAKALREADAERFLELTRLSGASSAMFLQNVSVAGAVGQPTMVAIALAEELLGERGAVRVHGGGFGGTIQAFVPLEMVEAFCHSMNAALGCSYALGQEAPAGAPCQVYGVDHKGARAWWL